MCKINLYTGSTTPLPGIADDYLPRDPRDIRSRPRVTLGLTLPDGKRAVATHNGHVELIDIIHNTSELLDERYFIAAWSPDGKWLALVEKGENGHTILLDAVTLKPQRILGNSELDWSPDSRFLSRAQDVR